MWHFLSRGYGETEGFSNGSLAEFKGNPLQSLAREVCQNSLDAADGTGRPVIVEFEKIRMPIKNFPGMASLQGVLDACARFWEKKGDVNTKTFLAKAKACLRNKDFWVLRVSDYHTTGVTGSFSREDITPWGSLVKGNAFSVKKDEKNAAGSYGIGKAAPFVNSCFQTVFYRTLDNEGVHAALGVARLMAHDSTVIVPAGEDTVRRSVGYYGENNGGKPSDHIAELDRINERDECGTDLFIPGFIGDTDGEWIQAILQEVADNFLASIYAGKLEVSIDGHILNRRNLQRMLGYIGGVKGKDAKIFYDVMRSDNEAVVEETLDFHGLGTARLRLLYANGLNKKVLVVRSSGMKIARIPSLPHMMSYAGFLELQGDRLNAFFREMENPRHNAWEPSRHSDPALARRYKDELENWVRDEINKKLIEISGAESLIDVGDCFRAGGMSGPEGAQKEDIIDQVKEVEIIPVKPVKKEQTFRVRNEENGPSEKTAGKVNPDGQEFGHRNPTGGGKAKHPTGRAVSPDPEGPDSALTGNGKGQHMVQITARIIGRADGANRLIFTPEEDIARGRIEIVTRGENGSSHMLQVREATGENISVESGRIVLKDIQGGVRQKVIFRLADQKNYAMGVKAYGN